MVEFCQAAPRDGILVGRLNQISAVPILTTQEELQAMPPVTPLESHSSMPGGPHKILRVCAPCLFQLLSSRGTWILSLLPSSPVTPRLVRPGETDTNDQWSEGSPDPTYARCQHKLIPLAQMVKNLPAMQETQFQSLGQEYPLEKGMTTHSNILAWRIPWTEDPTVHWGHKESDRIERPLLERPPQKVFTKA